MMLKYLEPDEAVALLGKDQMSKGEQLRMGVFVAPSEDEHFIAEELENERRRRRREQRKEAKRAEKRAKKEESKRLRKEAKKLAKQTALGGTGRRGGVLNKQAGGAAMAARDPSNTSTMDFLASL